MDENRLWKNNFLAFLKIRPTADLNKFSIEKELPLDNIDSPDQLQQIRGKKNELPRVSRAFFSYFSFVTGRALPRAGKIKILHLCGTDSLIIQGQRIQVF